MAQESFYIPQGEGFLSTDHTRGPWNPEHQHGGPPSALLAREMERRFPPPVPMQIVRFHVEVLRPIPVGLLRVEARLLREGKKVRAAQAALFAENKEVCRAGAQWIRSEAGHLPARTGAVEESPLRPPEGCKPFEFPFRAAGTSYINSMEGRASGGKYGSGAFQAWMRMRVPLLPGEAPTGVQRVLIAADSGSGLSAGLNPMEATFLNPDLTVYLHREPQGEWIGFDARSIYEPHGIGLAQTLLCDERGPIGRGAQSLVVERRGK